MSAYMEKAEDALASAQLLLDAGRYVGAVDRAYYAVFHAQRAVIAAVCGIDPGEIKTHHGVRQMFEMHVVKAGLIELSIAADARPLEAARIAADYMTEPTSREEAEAAIACARPFVAACDGLVRDERA